MKQKSDPHRRFLTGPAALALALVVAPLLLVGCGGLLGGGGGTPMVWGYVLRVSGTDTVPVGDAQVWTEPLARNTRTDSTGYWSLGLDAALVPDEYQFHAQLGAERGVTQVVLRGGRTTGMVDIILGEMDRVHVPVPDYDPDAGSPMRTRGKVRCCGSGILDGGSR